MLCLSGFELYSRWVPLPLTTLTRDTVNHLSFFKIRTTFFFAHVMRVSLLRVKSETVIPYLFTRLEKYCIQHA